MILTLDDYAELMGMPTWAISGVAMEGDLSCGPLSCAQRIKIISDLLWAESAIEGELVRFGMSLHYKPSTILTDQPYAIKNDDDLIGVLSTIEVDVSPSVVDDTFELAIELSADDFDVDCDTVLSYEIKRPAPGGFAVRWLSTEREGLSVTLSAKTLDIADVSCDNGEVDLPDSVTVVITILRATGPRMTRSSNGCSVNDDAECGRCGGDCYVEGCYQKGGATTLLMDFSAYPCACRGRLAYYTADLVRQPVALERYVLDAIVSLANSRGTLNDCGDCSTAARDRVAREYGVLSTSSKDLRETAPYLFVNPFGVFTPGAVSAWRAVERITAGHGGAGMF